MSKNILFLLFVLSAFSSQAETVSITIAKSFLAEYKPVVVLIHDYEGEVIHTQNIKWKLFRGDEEIHFENHGLEKFALTAISIRENTGKEYFLNQSFFGIIKGYVLEYEKTSDRQISSPQYANRIKIFDPQKLGNITKVIGARKLSRVSEGNFVVYNSLSSIGTPLFFTLSTDLDKHYYYLNTAKRKDNHSFFEIDADELLPIDRTFNISLPDTFNMISIRAKSKLLDRPIFLGSMLDTNYIELPYPDDLEIDQFDITARIVNFNPAKGKYYPDPQTHYYSVDKLPLVLEDINEPYSIKEEKPFQFSIKTSLFYGFFSGSLVFRSIKNHSVSTWYFYGEILEAISFSLPDIPIDVLENLSILYFENKEWTGGFGLISADKENSFNKLSSPFIINDKEWRFENSSKVVGHILRIE